MHRESPSILESAARAALGTAITAGTLALAIAPALAFGADAAPAGPSPAELQRQLDLLGQEVQKLKIGEASAEPAANQAQLGFGPGVSKVYRQQQGLSIGGYGEIILENFRDGFDGPGRRVAPTLGFDPATDGQRRFDMTRAVLYVGYRFDDNWVLNSELEFEHAGEEISSEFLYLDRFIAPAFNLRFGKLLMPVGLTNEIHEPPTYFGTHRPTVETLIIPTTWSEYGAGVFGDAGPFTYRSYVVTGLNASGFAPDVGIREGRHEGGFANANTFASVTRVDYTGTPGLLAGGSLYFGEASVDPAAGFDPLVVPARIVEAHVQYHYKAVDLRALGAYSVFSNIDALNARRGAGASDSVGSRQAGFYLQAGYDLLSGSTQALMPFVRWEFADTQLEVPPGYAKNGNNLIRELVAGVNYKPHPQIVLKADYQWYFLGDGLGVNQWNLAMGYVF